MNPSVFLKSAIEKENASHLTALQEDYDALGKILNRRGLKIDELTQKAMEFQVAVPSWGTGTGGTRFAVFSGKGEPKNVYQKLEDCAAVNNLVGCTQAVSLHIPWDKAPNVAEL
ncbi:MAG: sugar isomerase, partial [Fibrobacteres bacterium]|nr:sugar isomerase [Fibrobacterota bacterium]